MLGLRGIPNVQGGVERHVEMLSRELTRLGWQVTVIGRRSYLPERTATSWNGVDVVPIWSPRKVALEAAIHTLLGVLYSGLHRPDILHIHAIGPSLMVPLARLLGLKVVVTHHGFDYNRQKWGPAAKRILKLGEALGMRFANGRIAIAGGIAEAMRARYGVPVNFIPNGVAIDIAEDGGKVLEHSDLSPQGYILTVARLVPEKRQTDLIDAFAKLKNPVHKLVIVGGSEFETSYSRQLAEKAREVPGVVMTGFQTGNSLAALFANAALFVLPSSHEGMPIALLEALGHGLPVLASDIPANLEVGLPMEDHFPLGDVDALAAAIERKLSAASSPDERRRKIQQIEDRYGWASIAERTAAVYSSLLA
ncbi:glycosyltransferase family 4 protein [Chelativorans salis]|uniref:Glycosyltransferase family 4 protein n=1 Tax=Chelativorans salis TaxID=2978478 RepID=A0ABT2LQ99_9HYPH|nr:glycosyltransferase family 4 protein [Chelativorans sp. EGI FJ00035]